MLLYPVLDQFSRPAAQVHQLRYIMKGLNAQIYVNYTLSCPYVSAVYFQFSLVVAL